MSHCQICSSAHGNVPHIPWKACSLPEPSNSSRQATAPRSWNVLSDPGGGYSADRHCSCSCSVDSVFAGTAAGFAVSVVVAVVDVSSPVQI